MIQLRNADCGSQPATNQSIHSAMLLIPLMPLIPLIAHSAFRLPQ
jgi:hypothetical protein